MNLAENNSSSFESIVGASVGTTAGYYSYKNQNRSNLFQPVLDPRTNILTKIQDINIDNAINQSIRRFQVEHAVNKIDDFYLKASTYNTFNRLETVRNINQVKTLLQENMIGHSKNGPVYSSISPVTNLSFKRIGQLTDKGIFDITQGFAKTEWNAAIQATFPNPLEARIAHGSNAFEAIKMTIKNNPSILMQRAFNVFDKNMRELIHHGITESAGFMSVNKIVSNAPLISVGAPYSLGESRLKTTISSIQEALGTTFEITRRGRIDQGELSFFLPGRNKALFTIPEAFAPSLGDAPGLIRTGAGLHNVYAPGLFGIVDKSGTLSKDYLDFSEMKAQNILNAVLKENLSVDSPRLQNIINFASEESLKLGRYMEPNISGDNFSIETAFKANQLTVIDENFSPVKGDTRRKIAKELYESSITPVGAGSRFSLIPEQEAYGKFASSLDYSRKPWQDIRQYTPTSQAMALNKASEYSGEEFSFMDSSFRSKSLGGPSGARMKTLYLSESEINALQNEHQITIGDGELLVTEKMKKNLQVSRIKRININELDTHVANLMKRGGVTLENIPDQLSLPNIPVKGILGRNAEGLVVSTKYPTTLIGVSPNVSKGLDDISRSSLDLILKETIDMSNSEKVFGSLKGMARFVNDPNLIESISKVTGRSKEEVMSAEAFARSDDLKDNARKIHAALSNFILEGKKTTGRDIDLTSIIDELSKVENTETESFESGIDRILKNKAEEYGFKTSLSLESKSGGFGVAQLSFGGMKELTGAGNIGTIEPRIFSLLEASNPGGLGKEIGSEFLERMLRWSPDKVSMQEELLKSISSIGGQLTPDKDSFILEATSIRDKNLREDLFRRGGFVKTDIPEMPHIYIPGYETVPQLHPRMIDTGAVVDTSQPGKIYRNILRDLSSTKSVSGTLSHQQFLANMSEGPGYLGQLLQEAAIAGKGAGALTRGQVPGSRALTLLSEINPTDQSSFQKSIDELPQSNRIVGISNSYADEMFSEMEKLYGQEAISSMKTRFDQGDLIAGTAMRHPTIGPYSMQPVLFKKINSNEPVILASERMKNISFTSPAGQITKSIQMGILPGLAADKDADTVIAMLLSPQMEEKMRQQLINEKSVLSQQLNSYQEHSIRAQLLKPKAVKGSDMGISLADKRAAEATKLAITSEEVGILSSNLTKSKTAIMASSLPQDRKMKSLSLLEWLEQQPISGKHIAVKQAMAGMFENQMQALSVGAQGNAPLLQNAIEDMTTGISSELKPLFYEGLDSNVGRISGFDLPTTTTDIARSVREMRSLPPSSQLSIINKYATPSASGTFHLSQIPDIISANTIRKTGSFSEVSRGLIANINNEISSAVNKVRPFIKPLVVGAAIGGLTLAALTPVPSSMPSPDKRSSKIDNLEIGPVVSGNPSVAPQMQQVTTDMSNSSYENRKGIKASIRANNLTTQQRQALSERLNSRYPGSQLNLNIKDDRRTLNPHAISDMLDS